jgi:L,D-transpeptidase YcbB
LHRFKAKEYSGAERNYVGIVTRKRHWKVDKFSTALNNPEATQELEMHTLYLARTLAASSIAAMILLPGVPGSGGEGEARAQQRIYTGRDGSVIVRQPRNVFELVFPQLMHQRPPQVEHEYERRRRLERRWGRERVQRERRVQPVEIQKVSSPQYYDYAPQKLVRVELADMMARLAQAAEQQNMEEAETVSFDVDRIDSVITQATGDGVPAGLRAFDRISDRFAELTIFAEPAIAAAITEQYVNRPQLLWLTERLQPNARARSVLPVLESAGNYGLSPEDYEVALPDPRRGELEAEAARFEIEMTARAIRYGMDASVGRIEPNKLSGYHDFPKDRISAAEVVTKLVDGGLPAKTLIAFHPDNPQFDALRRELVSIDEDAEGLIVIPDNILVRPGETHPQIANVVAAIEKRGSPELQARAVQILAAAELPLERLTPQVVALVKDFQRENSLSVDGVIGPNTVSQLTDIDPETKRQRTILAMERLRWHPRRLGRRHVFINQPEFRARYMVDNESKLDMRVVVGTTENQTSFFHDVIETIEYNPYWGIPRSILVNEYLHKLRQNPSYLDERGYEVTDRNGRQIASASINWNAVGSNPPYDVRQRPGPNNALGELKILFPNKHAIYMHDTPARHLFERANRAFSHGCVRLQDPRAMAAAVLGKSKSHVAERISLGHDQEQVPGNIPVYVAYFTAWPDSTGRVGYFADTYGRDGYLLKAIEKTRAARSASS